MLQRIWFRPRVLRDVAEVDPSSSILGVPTKLPLFICPMGLTKMMHPEAEKAMARAADKEGIVQLVSLFDCSSLGGMRFADVSTE